MRKDDHVEGHAGALRARRSPDDAAQLRLANELLRREGPDSDHQLRSQKAQLAIEMRAAIRDFQRTGNTITAALCVPSREAANDRAHVDTAAKCALVDPELLEPTEESPSGGVRERSSIFDFVRSRRLPDEHDFRAGDRARDGLAENVRAHATRVERR